MASNEESVRKVIALGAEAKALMDNEALNHVFAMLEKQYWTEFKQATSAEERANVQAKAQVLDGVRRALHVMMDSGRREELLRDRREQKDARANH